MAVRRWTLPGCWLVAAPSPAISSRQAHAHAENLHTVYTAHICTLLDTRTSPHLPTPVLLLSWLAKRQHAAKDAAPGGDRGPVQEAVGAGQAAAQQMAPRHTLGEPTSSRVAAWCGPQTFRFPSAIRVGGVVWWQGVERWVHGRARWGPGQSPHTLCGRGDCALVVASTLCDMTCNRRRQCIQPAATPATVAFLHCQRLHMAMTHHAVWRRAVTPGPAPVL